jgi:hypothetical protein
LTETSLTISAGGDVASTGALDVLSDVSGTMATLYMNYLATWLTPAT